MSACQQPCCVEKREREEAWKMLTELYRVLVLSGSFSGLPRHAYSFNRRTASVRAMSTTVTLKGGPYDGRQCDSEFVTSIVRAPGRNGGTEVYKIDRSRGEDRYVNPVYIYSHTESDRDA